METMLESLAGSTVEKLIRLADAPERHDIPYEQLRAEQIQGANERFQSRRREIKLLNHRAEEAKLDAVRSLEDLVPLLFAHTAYKSYPESWFTEGKWDRMGRWLDTVVTYRVRGVDLNGVTDVDDWLERLAAVGHFVSCSSGTTGKCSMLDSSDADLRFAKRSNAACFEWATGLPRARQFKMISTAPTAKTPRAEAGRAALAENFGDVDYYAFPGQPITIGQVSKMVALRRRITEGTAQPGEIAAFEATSAEREKALDAAIAAAAEQTVANRHRPIMVSGMYAGMYRVAETVRAMGYSGKDFHPGNALNVGGGLKGAVLPANYREFIFETFNIQPQHICHMYAMQDINSAMPRCPAGRYHIPPQVIILPLTEDGEQLAAVKGEIEGRAGFFDLSVDGRWGGLISGDKVHVDFGPCACGHEGPTLGGEITRYSELPGGDKITCAGTIDAYVRGVG
jgi:hypothetical protein